MRTGFKFIPFPRAQFYFKSKIRMTEFSKMYEAMEQGGPPLFRNWLSRCRSCKLRQEGHTPVLPEGSQDSRYVFLGRNPGRMEDKYKRPFCPEAPAGGLLNQIMDRLNIRREDSYITNANFCHGEGDRAPDPREREMCLFWKQAEFGYLKEMKYLFPLGNEALFSVIGPDLMTISRAVGSVWQYKIGERRIMIVPLFHPAHLQRNPSAKDKTFLHLNGVRELMKAEEKDRVEWSV